MDLFSVSEHLARPVPPPAMLGEDGVVVEFDLSVYPEGAILAAAHRMSGRAYVSIEGVSALRRRCRLVPRQRLVSLAELAGEFGNTVLDEVLRERLRRETATVRAVLIAQAFSRTNLLDPELDDAEPELDPKGFAASDREHRAD